jgi:pilus assembly protein CpaB
MVAVSIPINRLSSVSYAPQSGDHVNVIASLLLVDMDTDWQSITPNHSAAVLGVGPGVITGSGDEEGSTTSSANVELQKITAQIIAAGEASVIGRADIDPLLEQTFYIVPSERQRPRLVSQTLIQDAIVLRVGDFPVGGEDEPESAGLDESAEVADTPENIPAEQTETTTPEPKLPDLITLIVTPQDAVTINYLIYSGAQLTLALRSAGDDTRVQTEAATLDYLLTQYNVPVPVKLPYGMEPRVDQLLPPQLPNDILPAPEE